MKIFHTLEPRGDRPAPALAIGFFDGLHRGHRALLDTLRPYTENGARLAALTFKCHPLQFLRPQDAPRLLVPLEERINLLAGSGIEELYLLDFNDALASLEARAFLEEILIGRLHAVAVAVGTSFRFGAGRQGDIALAAEVLQQAGVAFHAVDHIVEAGERISSTRIRVALEGGRIDEVDQLLGRPYAIRGTVTLGAGRGHDLGFPTANLDAPRDLALPPDGVYTAHARYDGQTYSALVSIGPNPTFDGGERHIEVWIDNFSATIYGREVRVEDLRFIRGQQKFASVADLETQMHKDVDAIRHPAAG